MSEIDYAHEVRDVLAFYKKHGRRLPEYGYTDKYGKENITMTWFNHEWNKPSWGDYALFARRGHTKDTYEKRLADHVDYYDQEIEGSATLDLLTMDLMRWAKEVDADQWDFAAALGIEITGYYGEVDVYWRDDPPMPHRALMAAIEEAKEEA